MAATASTIKLCGHPSHRTKTKKAIEGSYGVENFARQQCKLPKVTETDDDGNTHTVHDPAYLFRRNWCWRELELHFTVRDWEALVAAKKICGDPSHTIKRPTGDLVVVENITRQQCTLPKITECGRDGKTVKVHDPGYLLASEISRHKFKAQLSISTWRATKTSGTRRLPPVVLRPRR
jgi:hypothetical protein